MIRKSLTRIVLIPLAIITISVLLGEVSVATSNTSQNAASFLRIGQGARSAGLGGAYTAISDGAIAAYWNPAGLASLKSSEVALGHFAWLQDITVEQMSLAMPAFNNMVSAVSITYVNYGTIQGFDEAGLTTGELSAYDLAAGLSLGIELTDAFSAGITGKYVTQRLDSYHASAFAADVGIKYYYDRWTLAATLNNVGTSLKFDLIKESLPQSLRLGAAYRPHGGKIVTSLEWEHEREGETFVRQGVELGFSDKYFIRSGYDYVIGVENQSFTSGLSIGAGVILGSANIDYAFTPDYRSISEGLHRFTVIFNLGKIRYPNNQNNL